MTEYDGASYATLLRRIEELANERDDWKRDWHEAASSHTQTINEWQDQANEWDAERRALAELLHEAALIMSHCQNCVDDWARLQDRLGVYVLGNGEVKRGR